MFETLLLGSIAAVVIVALFFLERSRKLRRLELQKKRFSSDEREELIKDFKLFGKLPDDVRDRLEGLMHLFIDEKTFEACGGLEEITPHMQRVIAAQACLLVVNRSLDSYKDLRNLLIYPGAFGYDERGVRLGESWSSGSVIISWEAALSGGRNPEDGHDVSIHEFSHQLDQANDAGIGLPFLDSTGAYREWSSVFTQSFKKFCQRVDRSKNKVIDSYGAENPAEFFAVSTETFFEKPKQLKREYPELYEVLSGYYGLNPVEWK